MQFFLVEYVARVTAAVQGWRGVGAGVVLEGNCKVVRLIQVHLWKKYNVEEFTNHTKPLLSLSQQFEREGAGSEKERYVKKGINIIFY